MKKPHPKRTRHQTARRVRHALVVGTGLLALPEAALAQTATCSGSTLSCTIPAGSYSEPLLIRSASTAAVSFTNNGNFGVTTPQTASFLGAIGALANGQSGAESSTSNGGAAQSGGTMTFTNNGVITHSISALINSVPNTVNTVYGASMGGNGGNYTNTDASHSAGSAGNASGATVTNSGAITVNQGASTVSPTILVSGSALAVDSVGGNGGGVKTKGPDQNGNPTYGTQNGTPGGSAGNVQLTNSGAVTVSLGQPLFAQGYWGAAARSLGGNGGTGNNGQAGGSAGTATASSTANISVSVTPGQLGGGGDVQASTPGFFALLARSQGGVGNMSVNSGNNGGAGGNAAAATVTAGDGTQPVTITLNAVPASVTGPNPLAAAVAALSLGGRGGAGYDSSHGGNGGVAGPSTITLNAGTTIRAEGQEVIGVLSLAQGGIAGTSGIGQNHSSGGTGGSTGQPNSGPNAASISMTNAIVSTTGANAGAVMAIARGGLGGIGLVYTQALGVNSDGGTGGAGGSNGAVRIDATGSTISTTGFNSPGVFALTQGGDGGYGGDANSGEGSSGAGGRGGDAAPVVVNINAGTQINTSGVGSIGVSASSLGGAGGLGGALNVELGGGSGNGGAGAGGWNVTVTLLATSSVTTQGDNAIGVLARSVGGAGGAGSVYSTAGGIATSPPNGGPGGNSGTVVVTSGAQITTSGAAAHGIVAQSTTGTGGAGGNGAGVIYAPAGSGGAVGFTGSATVTNTGIIRTSGLGAMGIMAQSIGGDSGSGGSVNGAFITVGGSGASPANGNLATVTHSGTIITQGQGSIGILTQSIGGGGGNGGNATGVFASVGGQGTGGGNADTTTVNLSGAITTGGQLAHGVVAQSIGGGGGTGGNATAVGTVASLAIGGTAGGGGAGGAIVITGSGINEVGGRINTFGSNAIGLLGQSIGGGGGSGGGAYAVNAGVAFAAGVSVGGSGGSGGAAGTVNMTVDTLAVSTGQGVSAGTNTNPVDAFGIVLQSIGGGGGAGGAASAVALSAGIPNPAEGGKSFSATMTYAMGGTGATGGNGGPISLTLGGNSSVSTQGQGSHGILLQSIGGGGGSGGDSSAMAATVGFGRAASAASSSNLSVTASVAVGGNGSVGGAGSNIVANLNATSVTTFGDFANALVLQTIGGGGGNGGVGSSTTNAYGTTNVLDLKIGLGGRGSKGGDGGQLEIFADPNALLRTYGAGAVGLLGQSIGGGGGTSQGSTVNLGIANSGDNNTTYSVQVNVSVGNSGGAGGNGGGVYATMNGGIRTWGGDSSGVVLQSVGGGGGVGGSAGADASSDNPISTLTGLRGALSDRIEGNTTQGYYATLAVGGRGGTAGNGNIVSYTQGGIIITQGDWSHGVVAQSIGGGGGMGGVATSNASGASFLASLALGGDGGSGGAGGQVNLRFSPGSSITTGVAGTSGYAAFGVLAQSIGGGGGTAADGSAQSQGNIFVGGGASLSGGSAGNADIVQVTGTTTIVTRGDVAVGLALQSIGGGGGMAGSGSSLSAKLPVISTGSLSQLIVGGAPGASGNSGGAFITNATLNIQTSGAHAYGILAQAIGGGGGFGFTAPGNANTLVNAGGATSSVASGLFMGNGSAVRISLIGGSIQTSGFGAHGIVAQSIGGGGGIAGLPTTAAGSLTTTYTGSFTLSAPAGTGSIVNIQSTSPITTRGDFAYGILAQSIGGGGGLITTGGQVFAGTNNAGRGAATSSSLGAEIDILQSAPLSATGRNSVGIFAQSRGASGDGPVLVGVQAAVQGGSGPQGYGIWVDSRNTSSEVGIAAGASLSALSGNALLMTAGRGFNQGTVTGNVTIGNGGSFINQGTHNTGTTADVAEYVNTGLVAVATHLPFGVTTISGNFTQGRTGRIAVDADFTGGRSDVMVVQGSANLDGRVRPRISSVLPNVELPFLVVNGAVTGRVEGDQTEIFGYTVNRKGGTFSVAANADFTPAGYSLSRNTAAMAGHLQAAWDAGGAGFGPLFALLGNTADAGGEGAYSAALRQISPNSSLAPGARVAAGGRAFANAAMSCPQFEGSTAMLTEGECVWAGLTGRTAAQSGSDGLSSFRLNSTTWQAGGQRAMGGGWFLGGSIAYENARLTTTDGLNSGRGQSGFAAVTTKYQTGPWLFAGAVFGGGGEFNSTRTIQLPGFGSIARGSPTLLNAGAMLRATYTLGREEFYLRPSMTLSLVHARSGAYAETGAGVLNLNVSSASNTVAGLTPALEVGGRTMRPNGVVMRVFTAAGVSLLSEGRWSQQSRLASAPASAGAFSSVVRTDQVVGRVTAGVQVFATERLELRLQYEGEYSSNLTGHGGSFAVAYRF